MPTYGGHKMDNYTKEIPSNGPKKTGIESWLQASKCSIEEIACKIDLGKLEISLFGFKTNSMK
jgi:hypothetical protein